MLKIRHYAKPQNVSGKCNKTPFQMTETYIQDKTFDRNDTLTKGEYENCIFNSCNFADSDLSEFKFTDCIFNGCNLSLAKLNKTAFRDVKFKDCKMLGLRFDTCNEFGLSFWFDGCQLNHSSFYKTKTKKTVFKNSQLQETDFAEADLTSSVFDNCNLTQAVFDHTTLEKADFRTSYNYSIDPETNRIKKAKFSILGISGLLDKYDIDIEK
ncbi:MAG: pentapeptide repeat-containing protein [Bacteroidia bacterium]